MRIIGGTHRSRRINAPRNLPMRPTTDFAKESLFNILENKFDLETVCVLDLFSGTGAISYEFASRGAKKITSVEKTLDAYKFIKNKSHELGFSSIEVIKADVFKFLESTAGKYDIIFADPPYNFEAITEIPGLGVFTQSVIAKRDPRCRTLFKS